MYDDLIKIIVSLLEERVKLLRELELAKLDKEVLEGNLEEFEKRLRLYESRNPKGLN